MGKKRKSFQLELHLSQSTLEQVYDCVLDPGQICLTYKFLKIYVDKFLFKHKVYIEVMMTYLSEEKIQIINTSFKLPYGIIESKYDGLFVVVLSSAMTFLHNWIDGFDKKIESAIEDVHQLQEQPDLTQYHDLVLKEVLSIPEQVVRMVSKVFCDEVIDFALVFSEPLLTASSDDLRVPLVTEQSKCTSGLQRLKDTLRKSSQSPLNYRACVGTKNSLLDLFNQCSAVIIFDCNNDIDYTSNSSEGEAYLSFEAEEELGKLQKITQTHIRNELLNTQQSQMPQLVVIRSPYATKLANAFLQGGVLSVLVVQSYDFEEDTAVQIFMETFILLLLRGDTVSNAFQHAKSLTFREKASRSLNLGTCCCFHYSDHGPDCRQRLLEAEIGLRRCHELYHVPTCKCPRRSDNLHKQTCPWALQALFTLNKDFRITESDGHARRLYKFELEQLIGDDELLVCCCCKHSREIDHENKRFQLFGNCEDAVIFKKASDQDLDVEPDMKDKTELHLFKEFHRIERIYGRNHQMVKLMRAIQANRVLVFYGPVGSGRTSLTTKATSYMAQRQILKQDILYLNIGNCSRRVDFQFKFCKTAKLVGNFETQQLRQAYGYKRFLLVLDDCDSFVNNSYNDFLQVMTFLLQTLPMAKLLLIISSETERTHSNFLLGQKRFLLTPLSIRSATDLFLYHAKEYLPLRELIIQNVWELFTDEGMRYPKTILDMAYFLRTPQSSRSKVDFNTLKAYAQKVQLNLATGQKFLQQNLAELEKDQTLYNLFLLLCQFPNGLSQLDFEIMASHQVEGKYTFVPKNWKEFLTNLLAVNNQTEPIQFMKEGEYYFCLVERREGSWKLRAKKYIIDYLQRQGLSSNIDLRFKAVAYLATLSTVLLRLFREKGQYQEKLLEHNSFSSCGFFQFEKGTQFAEFFDEGDFYPGRTVNVTKSIMYGRKFDSEVSSIFAGSRALQAIEPYKCLLEHQQNFITLYQTDFKTFYSVLAPQRRKLFKYYFQNILLNVPTLSKLVGTRVPRSFLLYTIEQSIKKVTQLEPESTSKSNNILLIKLYLMLVDFTSQKSDSTRQSYKPFLDKISEFIKLWAEDSFIHKVKQLEIIFINMFTQSKNFQASAKDCQNLVPDLIKTIQSFDEFVKIVKNDLQIYKKSIQIGQIQKTKKPRSINSIVSKFNLMIGHLYFRQINKSKYSDQFNFAYPYDSVVKRLSDVREVFLKQNLKSLEFDTMLLLIRLRLNSLESLLQKNVRAYMDIYKSLIKPCRKILQTAKTNSNQKECELAILEGTVNRRIWEATRNVIVLMASAPLTDQNGKSLLVHTNNRRKKSLRQMMEESIVRKLQMERVQKQIFVRYQLMTLKNFTEVMNVGCSILIEYVDVSRDVETGDLLLHAENQWVPTQECISVKSFLDKVSFNAVELLIIFGQNSSLLGDRIEKDSSDPPFIISIEPQPISNFINKKKYNTNEPFLEGYYDYCIRTLQTVISTEFLRLISEQIIVSKKDIRGKDIHQLFRSAIQGSLVYSIGFSKQIANRVDFETLVKFRIHDDKHRNIELLFESGQYHNISTFNLQLHNMHQSYFRFVGRQALILELIQHLQKMSLTNQACLVNVYGPKGSGKTLFVQQCAKMLLQRGNYPSGVYLLSGLEIDTIYQADVDQYIEKHNKELFKSDYLKDENLDGQQVLIIIDDYHLLRDRSQSLSKFLTTLDQKSINLIVTSREPLEFVDEISDEREALNILVDKLDFVSCSQLAYSYIPFYDFNSYSSLFRNVFESLKNKNPEGMLPKLISGEYSRLQNKGSRAFSKQAGRYPSYKDYIQNFDDIGPKFKKKKKSVKIQDFNQFQQVELKNKPYSQSDPSTHFEMSPPSKFLKAESAIDDNYR